MHRPVSCVAIPVLVCVLAICVAACDRKSDPNFEKSLGSASEDNVVSPSAGNQPEASGLESISPLMLLGELGGDAFEQLEIGIEANPTNVAEWAVRQPFGSNRDMCLELVFGKWGSMDAPAAIDFVERNLSGMDRTLAAASIAEAAGMPSADAVLSIVSEPIPRGVVIRSLVLSAFESDPRGVISWTMKQSSPNDKKSALLAITEVWSARTPAECAAWVESNLKSGEKAVVIPGLLASWGRVSPRDAAKWLEMHKSGMDTEEAAYALVESWAFIDPKGAVDWSARIKNPEIREDLLETVVSNWVLNEAGNSIDWVSGIQDGELKRSLLESAFLTLAIESPDALEYWIGSNPNHPAIHEAEEVQAGLE